MPLSKTDTFLAETVVRAARVADAPDAPAAAYPTTLPTALLADLALRYGPVLAGSLLELAADRLGGTAGKVILEHRDALKVLISDHMIESFKSFLTKLEGVA